MCVGCECAATLWSSKQSRALRDWEVLWCFKTTWEDKSKAQRGERDGCGWEQLSGSKAQPRELESFLLVVRNEGNSWIWGSDLEVQDSGGQGGRTKSSRLTWGPWGRPCLQKGLNKTNLPANQSGGSGKWGGSILCCYRIHQPTNQEAAVKGRLFCVATGKQLWVPVMFAISKCKRLQVKAKGV